MSKTTDLIIIGSGPGSTVLASILAKNGIDVILIDAAAHPRFAIGESTIPLTSAYLGLIADRYGLPELKHLVDFDSVVSKVSAACGVKTNFGFVHHSGQRLPRRSDTHQLVLPGTFIGHESHFYRQDVDAFLLHSAINRGCRYMSRTFVQNIELEDDQVRVETACGKKLSARYLLDGSGIRSPFAKRFGLRQNPSRHMHNCRSMFTHMIGVKPYDDCVPDMGHEARWHQGTLHHVFRGGWLWVIPFNNHEKAVNPLVSVGLQLDPRVHPPRKVSPEVEFREFISQFPSIAEQFRDARAARGWIRAPRVQVSSSGLLLKRMSLLSHSAGFTDPLYSRGLANTLEHIDALAWRLLDAFAEDDFSNERFAYLERLHQVTNDGNDRVVHGSYVAFDDPRLWNAWIRLWAMGQAFGELRVSMAHQKALQTGDHAHYRSLEDPPHLGLLIPIFSRYERLMDDAWAALTAYRAEELTAEAAADRIFASLSENHLGPPLLEIADRNKRNLIEFNRPSHIRAAVSWMTTAPPDLKGFHKDLLATTAKHLVRMPFRD